MERLGGVPGIPATRLAVRVSKDAVRQVRGGHPWLFDASVRSVSDDGVAGQLAVIFGDRREFVAVGLYDPDSPIRVRVLHSGSPVAVDDAFWRRRTGEALDRRGSLLTSATTTACRLVHGENDGLGGLIVDRYDDTLVVKVYSTAWLPHVPEVLEALLDQLERRSVSIGPVVLRLSRDVRRRHPGLDGTMLRGDASVGPVSFLENGLRFEADVVAGQKTGHFLDQRDNRALIGSMAGERTVLDVFACTGGFSVHAAAGGARSVTSVDLSRRALDTARRNMAANADRPAVAACEHEIVVGDAFDVMEGLLGDGRRFGLVVVDPPSFAHRAADRPGALRAYARLSDLGLALTDERGVFVQSSCSSRITADELDAVVLDAIARSGRRSERRARTGHGLDHPVGFPEGEYLATVVHRLEPRRSTPAGGTRLKSDGGDGRW